MTTNKRLLEWLFWLVMLALCLLSIYAVNRAIDSVDCCPHSGQEDHHQDQTTDGTSWIYYY